MSLAIAALRIVTVKALDGATSVGARVFDSMADARDALGDEAMPAIIIYTDAGHIDLKDRAILEAPGIVDLTFEMFIARKVTVKNGAGDTEVDLEYPDNDAGYENYLQCLAYEVKRALLRRDGTNPWPGFWAELVARGSQMSLSQWDRGADSAHGRRFAFLRVVYRLEAMNDPVPGAPLPDMWSRLLSAMANDSELAEIAAYWNSLITDPNVPDWRQAQQQFGLIDAAMGAGTGLAPAFDTTTDAAPVSVEISGLDEAVTTVKVDPTIATIIEDGGPSVVIAE